MAASLRWHAGLYLRLIGARARSQVQYRLSFALDLCAAFFGTFVDFLAVVVIFSHLPRLAGWTLPEVAFFYGTSNLSFALSDLVVGHLDAFPALVRSGAFDLLLIRPAGSLFQVLTSDFALRRFGRIAQALVVLGVAITRLHVVWTVGRVAAIGGMTITGMAIFSGIWIIGSTTAFWTVEIREITNAFTYGGSFLASYPINLFGGWLRRVLAFIVPIGFVSYFPGVYVLQHPDPLGTPGWLPIATPLVACAVLAIAYRFWGFGVRRYRSTGS